MTYPDVGEIVVAVLTYKRVDDIVELAPLLVEQVRSLPGAGRVIVVDNDPEAGARQPIATLGLPEVSYVHETAAGIAHARNAALDAAADAHLLVFVDDDERPQNGWLRALVDTYLTTGATAVAGVVSPAVGYVDDPWIAAGEFFVRQRHRTGDVLPAASTANLLLDLRQVAALGSPRFDVAFGMTGGSDTMFTRTLVRRGGTIVWCDEAVVVDHIRVARITRSWVLQRAFRSGNSWSRTLIALEQRTLTRSVLRPWLSAKGIARIIGGTARELFGRVTRNLRHEARGRRSIARGAGMALGAWGVVYDEYGNNRASRAA
jgi:succinoglycan biosynthesis protein ExoM